LAQVTVDPLTVKTCPLDPVAKEVSCFDPLVVKSVEAVKFESVNDVPVADPMSGVVRAGDVAKTTVEPVPVDVAEIAIVPESITGVFETDMKDGTEIPTDVTVPALNLNYRF